MSHERSTPSSPGSEDFAPVPSTSGTQFASLPSGIADSHGQITLIERFTMGKSDAALRGLAGATGGFTAGVVTCPLDVIKTKLQAQGGFRAAQGATAAVTNARYSGMLGTYKLILKEEGVKGLYRGLGPIIMGYLPTWAVWFVVYGKAKDYFSRDSSLIYIQNPHVVNFCSSIVAGGSSTMVTNPIWVIKTRLMSQVSRKSTSIDARPPWHYKSTWDAAKKMWRNEGFLSFYSGLTPALLGLTHVAIQFPAYEYFRKSFTGQGMGESVDGGENHAVGILSASVLSKIIASSATYPHEVIRTRLQTQQRSIPAASTGHAGLEGGAGYKPSMIAKTTAVMPRYNGIITTAKTILAEEGWRAFYAGMGTNMMRAIPAAATTIFTYEQVMKYLNHAKAEGIHKSELDL